MSDLLKKWINKQFYSDKPSTAIDKFYYELFYSKRSNSISKDKGLPVLIESGRIYKEK